ncbi:hypothetical protein E2C01_047887 [Portunus trituberculatus]|uniref:Uncharacterized protein n=1 Tax=Portunus trituberculatus TaxID=210409 RepID=A0A5B7G4S3_PORTR|nr:hypothetical protein [Portunus trituberculatus]
MRMRYSEVWIKEKRLEWLKRHGRSAGYVSPKKVRRRPDQQRRESPLGSQHSLPKATHPYPPFSRYTN